MSSNDIPKSTSSVQVVSGVLVGVEGVEGAVVGVVRVEKGVVAEVVVIAEAPKRREKVRVRNDISRYRCGGVVGWVFSCCVVVLGVVKLKWSQPAPTVPAFLCWLVSLSQSSTGNRKGLERSTGMFHWNTGI
jgi:hypothetical protein